MDDGALPALRFVCKEAEAAEAAGYQFCSSSSKEAPQAPADKRNKAPTAGELASGPAWPCTVCGEVLRGGYSFQALREEKNASTPRCPGKRFWCSRLLRFCRPQKTCPTRTEIGCAL